MKTNRLLRTRSRFDWVLAAGGWIMAIFVSLLYLSDLTKPEISRTLESPPVVETEFEDAPSTRVAELLAEAQLELISGHPQDAIYCVTTLWSVCHTSNQPVPESSHRIFASAVSALSQQRRMTPERSLRPQIKQTTLGLEEVGELDSSEEKSGAEKVSKPRTAVFRLSEEAYPKSKDSPKKAGLKKSGPPPHAEAAYRPFPERPRNENRFRRPPAPPSSTQPYLRRGKARRGAQRPGFPPPPPGDYGPLQSRDGGRPPGY